MCRFWYSAHYAVTLSLIGVRRFVCPYVCPSARIGLSQVQMSPNFLTVSVHVTCGRGSVLLWRPCDMPCSIRSVSWITSFYHIIKFRRVRQVGAATGHQTTSCGVTGAKSAASNCNLFNITTKNYSKHPSHVSRSGRQCFYGINGCQKQADQPAMFAQSGNLAVRIYRADIGCIKIK